MSYRTITLVGGAHDGDQVTVCETMEWVVMLNAPPLEFNIGEKVTWGFPKILESRYLIRPGKHYNSPFVGVWDGESPRP